MAAHPKHQHALAPCFVPKNVSARSPEKISVTIGVGRIELVPSLEAFLHHNARWETAAAHLYVHRHTLRYRMRKVEELTGRELSNSFDRMEFWLALRARDLLAAEAID